MDLLWLFRNKYYLFKQYSFNGINMYTLLNLNTINSAGAATGAVSFSIPILIGFGGLFLSTLENVIPDNMIRTKAVVQGSKYVIGIPIRMVESTTNGILGFAERGIIGDQLPINVTADFRLTQEKTCLN